MKKRMLYIIPCGIPCDAPGIRAYNIACVFRNIGISVEFLSNNFYSDGVKKEEEYDGFSYSYVNSHKALNFKARMCNFFELLFAHRTLRAIKSKCDEFNYDYIMVYGGSYMLIKKLLQFCHMRDIKLLSDVTDWFEMREDLPFLSKIKCYQTDKRITELDSKTDGIIAISHFLYDFYQEHGAHVIRIPPVFSENEICTRTQRTWETPRLVYAGSPAKKDYLENVYLALQKINRFGIQIEFNVVGVSRDEASCIINPEEIGIHFYGRLPHAEAIKIVRESDFCILIRESKRYAKAGYSTKFAEAMSNGVPMICNKVGGCDLDIAPGENGFLIENNDVTSIEKCLRYVSSMTPTEISRMKQLSLSFARHIYFRDAYRESLKTFLVW